MAGTPNIRDIKLGHMQETSDLLELYRQAIGIGLAKPNEAGRLDFLALAEHAKGHGKRAGALFFWLLREKKTMFITQAEEDAAVTRIRALHNPDNRRDNQRQQWGVGISSRAGSLNQWPPNTPRMSGSCWSASKWPSKRGSKTRTAWRRSKSGHEHDGTKYSKATKQSSGHSFNMHGVMEMTRNGDKSLASEPNGETRWPQVFSESR